MARALIIGEVEKQRIAAIVELAKKHPFNPAEAQGLTGKALTIWKMKLQPFTLDIPIGYLVTYTQEAQPPGLCHHISISVDTDGKVPHPTAVAMICEEFGLKDIAEAVMASGSDRLKRSNQLVAVYPEEYETGRISVNLVARV
jgi:hypothetical protein